MTMTLYEFLADLKSKLSPLVTDDRYVLASSSPSLGFHGRGRGTAQVTFVNLPYERVRERRGGGAEAENNRMLFMVRGFNSGPASEEEGVEQVQVEQLVNNVSPRSENMRRKTASPDKVASYVAAYINRAAETHEPRLTHE
jgi:hypothetical protein